MIQAVSNWFEHLKENSCAVVKKETAVLIHINQTKLLQLIKNDKHWHAYASHIGAALRVCKSNKCNQNRTV